MADRKPLVLVSGEVREMAATDKVPSANLPASSGAAIWTDGGAFSRASDSTFTVTDDAAHQDIFRINRPIRYKATGGAYRYGFVSGYTTGTVTLRGAALTADFDDVIEYGDMTRLIAWESGVPGSFSDANDSALLANDTFRPRVWPLGRAYCCGFDHKVESADTGATQPNIQLLIAGQAICTANTNAGPLVSTSWQKTGVDIATDNCETDADDAMELKVVKGSNGNAMKLSFTAFFVLL